MREIPTSQEGRRNALRSNLNANKKNHGTKAALMIFDMLINNYFLNQLEM